MATKTVQQAPEMLDDRSFEALIARIDQCVKQHDRQRDRSGALHVLRDVPELVDERALKEGIAKIITARIDLARPAETTRTLAALRDPPEPVDPAALEVQWRRVGAAQAGCEDATRQTELSANALAKSEQQIREWVAANPSCPVCGGEVTAEKLLEGGHAHAH
jgi:hypothetical protein